MKPIDFCVKPIAPIARGVLNPLSPIANLLHGVVRNRFESQIHGNIYTYKNYYYLLTYYYIYTLTYIFSPVLRARLRACAREAMGIQSQKALIFYPHYCYECHMQYFGIDQNKLKPCTRCGSTNVVSSPLRHLQQKAIGSVAGGK